MDDEEDDEEEEEEEDVSRNCELTMEVVICFGASFSSEKAHSLAPGIASDCCGQK